MNIVTKDFREVCKTILPAVSNLATNLEVRASNRTLFLAVTNGEYYVSVKYNTDSEEEFRAVVDANLFLNLITGITTETFDLNVDDRVVRIKAGKSNYKLAIIYDNESILTLPVIRVDNKLVQMPIANDILQSILVVNSKEVQKAKKVGATELQKMYYITQDGCFTFTTGACINAFTLAQPVKMLLSENIVKLFKLFNEDVQFTLGCDVLPSGQTQTKVIFETLDTYLAAIIINEDVIINSVANPYRATQSFIYNENYAYKLVLSTKALSDAVSRLMLFTKHSMGSTDLMGMTALINIIDHDFSLTDSQGNTEVISIENGSYVEGEYSLNLNIFDLKLVLDSCKEDHINFNCDNHTTVVILRGNVANVIPESSAD